MKTGHDLRGRRRRGQSAIGVEPSASDLLHWEYCQVRTTAYLTTNGQIEISLCGLFATTVAVLVTLGQAQTAKHEYATFSLIIPAFSLVVLLLASRVHVWIREQLEYSAIAGLHPSAHKVLPSLEEWKEECAHEWYRLPWRLRVGRSLFRGTIAYLLLPCRTRDIYMSYFLIYIGVPLVSAVYATTRGTHWYVPVVWGILSYAVFAVNFSELERYEESREAVDRWIFASDDRPTAAQTAQEEMPDAMIGE